MQVQVGLALWGLSRYRLTMRNLVNQLLAGLREPVSTFGSIVIIVAIFGLSGAVEAAEPGVQIPLWTQVAASVGTFLVGLFTPQVPPPPA